MKLEGKGSEVVTEEAVIKERRNKNEENNTEEVSSKSLPVLTQRGKTGKLL